MYGFGATTWENLFEECIQALEDRSATSEAKQNARLRMRKLGRYFDRQETDGWEALSVAREIMEPQESVA